MLLDELEELGLGVLGLADFAILNGKSSGLGSLLLFLDRKLDGGAHVLGMEKGLRGFHQNDLVSSSAGLSSVLVASEFDSGELLRRGAVLESFLGQIKGLVDHSLAGFNDNGFPGLGSLHLLGVKSSLLESLLSDGAEWHGSFLVPLNFEGDLGAVDAGLSLENLFHLLSFLSSNSKSLLSLFLSSLELGLNISLGFLSVLLLLSKVK